MIPSRQAGDILSGMWLLISRHRPGHQDAAVGSGVRDRRDRAGQRAGGRVRRHPGHAGSGWPRRVIRSSRGWSSATTASSRPPSCPAAGSPRRRTSTTSWATGWPGPTPAPSARSKAGRWTCWRPTTGDAPLPPVAPPVGLTQRVRLGRDYYVRVDTSRLLRRPAGHRPLRRRHRLPDQVEAVCDGQPVARHDRSWAKQGVITDPDHRATAAQMRQALALQRQSRQAADPPARRRSRRRAARTARLRRPVRRRLHRPHHRKRGTREHRPPRPHQRPEHRKTGCHR